MPNIAAVHPEVNCNTLPFNSLSNPPATLTCHQCNAVSIPAPEGATAETLYICPQCSPLGPEEVHFDQCQFEAKPGRFVGINSRQAFFDYAEAISSRKSTVLLRAVKNRKAWALNATVEHILALPTKQRLAFMAVMCCGMTPCEAAITLEESWKFVKGNVNHAKKTLCSFAPHYNCGNKKSTRGNNPAADGRSQGLPAAR